MQTDRFKQFRAAIEAMVEMPILDMILYKPLLMPYGSSTSRYDNLWQSRGCLPAAQRFIGKVRINSRRTEAQQTAKWCGSRALAVSTMMLASHAGFDRPDGSGSRQPPSEPERQAIFSDIPVGEHQQHGAATTIFSALSHSSLTVASSVVLVRQR